MKHEKEGKVPPVTFTCNEAAQRHRGMTPREFIRLCNTGKKLLEKYGGEDRIPLLERRNTKYLLAEKVGKYWHIPKTELDRLFLGRKTQTVCLIKPKPLRG